MEQEDQFNFKFYFTQKKSNVRQGLIPKKGYLSNDTLVLDNRTLPLLSIGYTLLRGNRITLSIPNPNVLDKIRKYIRNKTLVLEISGKKEKELKKRIENKLSLMVATLHKEELEKEGKGDQFKSYLCPNCGSTIDFSDYSTTNYIYCRFCYSIIDQGSNVISNGNNFSLCDECVTYNAVKKYDVFYFYFFILIFGFRFRTRILCGNCASKIGKRTLLLNLIFLVGIPHAVFMLLKARKNSEKGEIELRKVNQNLRNGVYQNIDKYFDDLRSIFPSNPGICYNQAKAHLNLNDYNNGVGYLEESLNYCSNYTPSARLKYRLSKKTVTSSSA